MKNRVNIAIFISGKGSNLKSLIKFSLLKNSPVKIKLIISNNSKAKGLIYANKYKLKKKTFNFKDTKITEIKLLKLLDRDNIELICLAGFMRILSKNFIKKFKGKILNIHPSLLPKYKGLNTHERVLKNKEKFSGCTVHIVNHKLDSGKIVLQKKVKVKKNDSPSSLSRRILKEEHKLYPNAIKKILLNP